MQHHKDYSTPAAKGSHAKQQSSVFRHERDRKKELFGNKNIFAA